MYSNDHVFCFFNLVLICLKEAIDEYFLIHYLRSLSHYIREPVYDLQRGRLNYAVWISVQEWALSNFITVINIWRFFK